MNRVTVAVVILTLAIAAPGCQSLTGRPARQHFNDKWMLYETKGRIAVHIPRALTAVNVDVNRGTIYLMGTVATPEQKARAEEIARDVDGVREVVNHLELETESTSASPSTGAPNR